MRSIQGIAYRFFARNKFVAATSIMSVAISVALILTMLLFAFSAKPSAEDAAMQANLVSTVHFLIVLSVLLLVVTSLLLIANFDIFLYKYRNQFAIMRTLGASSRQLFKIAMLQFSLMNAAGAAAGMLLSYVVHESMQQWLANLYPNTHVDAGYRFPYSLGVTVVCFLFVELFMVVPSYRMARMLPMRIWRENERLNFGKMKLRKRVGKVMLGTSVVLVVLVLIANALGENVGVSMILVSALLLMTSLALLMPVYVSTIFTFALPIIRFLFGRTSYVAVKNVIPQVRKNTLIMMSITLMLVISIFGSATIQTLSRNQERYVREQYATDILATSRLGYQSEVDPQEFTQAIRSVPGVKSVYATSTAFEVAFPGAGNRFKSRFDYILGDLAEMSREGLLPPLKGEPTDSIVLTRKFAESHHLRLGDTVTVEADTLQPGGFRSGNVVVAAIVNEIPGTFVPILLDWSNDNVVNPYTRFAKAFITSNHSEETFKALESLASEYPGVRLNSLERAMKESAEIYEQRWTLFRAFLFVIMACVTFGVFETLVTSIYAKRKELAILRTMKLGRHGVRRVILTQVALYLAFGIVFGGMAGVALTFVMNLVDVSAGGVAFDFTNLAEIVGVLSVGTVCIFVPFAARLERAKLANELLVDHK